MFYQACVCVWDCMLFGLWVFGGVHLSVRACTFILLAIAFSLFVNYVFY